MNSFYHDRSNQVFNKSKRILFLVPYPKDCAPSQRLKFEQYFEGFEQHNYKVDFKSFVSPMFWKIIHKKGYFFRKVAHSIVGYLKILLTLFSLPKYDIVYTHLWVTPAGYPLIEWFVRKLSKKLVYDIDDLVYLKQDSQANPIIEHLRGKHKPLFLMQAADLVVTCTPYLDEFVRQYNNITIDISSTVDTTTRYLYNSSRYSEKNEIVIGWSGSHSTIKHLLTIKDVLIHIQSLHPEVKFRFMGSNRIDIDGLTFESLAWSEDIEMDVLNSFDIGIYPLPDEKWVLGKSGLKAIQYMALGIPTVATKIGTNFRVIDDGLSGFLVESEDEWIDTLSKLIADANLRQKIGSEGRQKVVKEFSVEANLPRYLEGFNQL